MLDNLISEAEAFDSQIIERVKNGHIPDLRYSTSCNYFYNNPWRHPAYVKIDYGEIFELLKESLNKYGTKKNATVLEVGCGPGFMTLEMAREGYDVTGIDLSEECIKVAEHFAAKDPHINERGMLHYITGDFFTHEELKSGFDAIFFVGALHHFPDQESIIARCKQLLNKDGLMLVHEPTRDRVEKKNAAVYLLIKSILFGAGGYFEEAGPFSSIADIDGEATVIFKKMKYEDDHGDKLQSVNDNSAGFTDMMGVLENNFEQLDFQDRYSFFHEMIGGLRFSEDKNIQLANTIKMFDKYFCEQGIIQPTEFYFAGRKK